MNKLTDSEIVKALEQCASNGVWACRNCPFAKERNCKTQLVRSALDFINRQTEQIIARERQQYYDELQQAKAEIERLQKRQRTVVAENAITALREKCIEHQDFHKGDDGVFRAYVSIEDLDNIISEM